MFFYLNNATRIFEEASLTQLRYYSMCYMKQPSIARIMNFILRLSTPEVFMNVFADFNYK